MARKPAVSKSEAKPAAGEQEARRRPVEYSDEIGVRICEQAAEGLNVTEICLAGDMPSRQTVFRWLLRHPAFMDMYARARQVRALQRVDKIDAIVADVLAGEIDPQAAKVAIDAHRWQASKEDAKNFWEKSTLNVNATTTPNAESLSETAQWIEGLLRSSEDNETSKSLPH